jgi:hypothetical protein
MRTTRSPGDIFVCAASDLGECAVTAYREALAWEVAAHSMGESYPQIGFWPTASTLGGRRPRRAGEATQTAASAPRWDRPRCDSLRGRRSDRSAAPAHDRRYRGVHVAQQSKGWACSSGCWNACPLRCLVWAGAECQEHSSEYSGEEWAAGNEQELSRYGQAGREPDECCPKG